MPRVTVQAISAAQDGTAGQELYECRRMMLATCIFLFGSLDLLVEYFDQGISCCMAILHQVIKMTDHLHVTLTQHSLLYSLTRSFLHVLALSLPHSHKHSLAHDSLTHACAHQHAFTHASEHAHTRFSTSTKSLTPGTPTHTQTHLPTYACSLKHSCHHLQTACTTTSCQGCGAR